MSANRTPQKKKLNSGRFGITCTFWDGPVGLVVVGTSKAHCREIAQRSMGTWESEVWSTPLSIYNDLTGITRERRERKGHYHNAHQDGLWDD